MSSSNTILHLFLSVVAMSMGNSSTWTKFEGLKDENQIQLFVPRVSGDETDGKRIQNLMNGLQLANELGVERVEVRFVHGLERNVCCFSEANYQHSESFHFDQEVLLSHSEDEEIHQDDILLFCQNIPFERSKFQGMDFDFQIEGANNFTPFHTTISNHPVLLKLVCGMCVLLPEPAYADRIAVVRFVDKGMKRHETLFLLQYENGRLTSDNKLREVLKSRNVILGGEFGYFVFTEPEKKVGERNSDCYLFLEKFVSSLAKEKKGAEANGTAD